MILNVQHSVYYHFLIVQSIMVGLCNSQTIVPLEIPEGQRHVIIDYPFTAALPATPTWIIGGVIYYIARLPPNFIQLPNGDLEILMIDSSLNHTTLQCIVPFQESQNLVSNITLLIVTEHGKYYERYIYCLSVIITYMQGNFLC